MPVHDNHLGCSMHRSAVLLRGLCHMVGSLYHPADLQEISWWDLQWIEIEQGAGRILVREEIVEDDSGVLSSVIVPTLASVPEDAMESEEGRLEESMSSADN